MDCDRIGPLLWELLDGRLIGLERELAEEHLQACSSCRKELSAIRRTIGLLTEWEQVDEPADLLHRVRQRIEMRERQNALSRLLPRSTPFRVLASVTSVALVAFGFWLAYKQFAPSPERLPPHGKGKDEKPTMIARAPTRGGEVSSKAETVNGTLAWKEKDGDGRTDAEAFRKKGEFSAQEIARLAAGGEEEERFRREAGHKGGVWASKLTSPGKGEGGSRIASVLAEDVSEKQLSEVGKHAALPDTAGFLGKGAPRPTEGAPPVEKKAIAATATTDDTAAAADVAPSRPGEPAKPSAERWKMVGGIATEEGDPTRGRSISKIFPAERPEKEAELEPIQEADLVNGQVERGTEPDSLYTGKLGSEQKVHVKTNELAAADEVTYDFANGLVLSGDRKAVQSHVQALSYFATSGRALHVGGRLEPIPAGGLPILLLDVKDGEKVLAQIRKDVADLGGTIQPVEQQGRRASGYSGASEPQFLVVRLRQSVLQSFQKKYDRFSWSRGFPDGAPARSESESAVAPAQPTAKPDDVTILLIQMTGVPKKEEVQQQNPED